MRFPLLGLILLVALFTVSTSTASKQSLLPNREIGDITSAAPAVIAPTVDDRPTRLIFVGDILLARNVELLMRKHGSDYPFRYTTFSAQPAYVIGNFEAAVPTTHRLTPAMNVRFSVASEHLSGLAAAGFTHVSLANNHSFDFGADGFLHTEQVLRMSGITPFGHPRATSSDALVSVVALAGGTRAALIGFNAFDVAYSSTEIADIVGAAVATSAVQVAFVHWGDEYQSAPNEAQRSLARALVAAGVDVVVGHHPHVLQSIELIDDVPVFYSLGNFVFDQYFSAAVQTSVVLSMDFERQEFRLLPVAALEALSQPRFLRGTAAEAELKALANLSGAELQSDICRGYLPFPLRLRNALKPL